MEFSSRQTRATKAAKMWQDLYEDYKELQLPIADELYALGGDPTPDAVDKVIGNKLWTYCTCDECKQSCDAVVRIGDEPDYDSATARVCRSCIEKALALFPASALRRKT